jgi:hypothetical protein
VQQAKFWDDDPLYKRLPLFRLQESVGPLPAALADSRGEEKE